MGQSILTIRGLEMHSYCFSIPSSFSHIVNEGHLQPFEHKNPYTSSIPNNFIIELNDSGSSFKKGIHELFASPNTIGIPNSWVIESILFGSLLPTIAKILDNTSFIDIPDKIRLK